MILIPTEIENALYPQAIILRNRRKEIEKYLNESNISAFDIADLILSVYHEGKKSGKRQSKKQVLDLIKNHYYPEL